MMYQEMKLEKGMYHITGKSFTEVLEEYDPSEQYADTAMKGLDAYERQLKRFGIRVQGPFCDRVEKFFNSTESAVLFPEFIRRSIRKGLEQANLQDAVGLETQCEDGNYLAAVFTDSTSYSTTTSQSNPLPVATYLEGSTAYKLEKFGRTIKASYEAIRRQRLDGFGKMLESVGLRLSTALLTKAIGVLQTGSGSSIDISGEDLTYEDLTRLYGQFGAYDMTTLLASPATCAKIMAMEQMKEMASSQPGVITLPFGAKLCKCAGMSDAVVVGLNQNFGLEMVTCGDVVLENDKLIDSQLDVISVSIRVVFRVLTADAVHILCLE